MKFIMLFYFNY